MGLIGWMIVGSRIGGGKDFQKIHESSHAQRTPYLQSSHRNWFDSIFLDKLPIFIWISLRLEHELAPLANDNSRSDSIPVNDHYHPVHPGFLA